MTEVTIYHNPRCSKSRATLALLQERGISPNVVEYLDNPPEPATLQQLAARLGVTARGLMRRQEADYRALELDDPALPEEALFDALTKHPVLIERPIVVTPRGVAFGRPPENVLDIL